MPRMMDPLTNLWRLAGSRRTFLALVTPLILGLTAAALLPQMSSTLPTISGAAYERALQQLAAPFGLFGSIGLTLGLFDIGHALWLRLLLAALAIHNLVRLADQFLLWRHLRRPTPGAPLPPSGLRTVVVHTPTTFAVVSERLTGELRARFRHVLHVPVTPPPTADPTVTHSLIHATRGAWGAVGNMLSYLGPLLVILALFASEQAGWREDGVQLALGQSWQLRTRPAITLTAGTFSLNEGRIPITVTRPGGVVVVQLGMDAPATQPDMRLYAVGDGPALLVSVSDANGRPLPLRPLTGGQQSTQPAVLFDRPQIEQSLALPLRGQALRLVYFPTLPEQGFEGPVYLLQGFSLDDEAPIFDAFLDAAAPDARRDIGVAGTQDTFHFQAARFVRVNALFDPGLPLALGGGLLTFIGLLAAQAQPPTRAWAWLVGRGDETIVTVGLLGSGPWTHVELSALQDSLAGLAAVSSPPSPPAAAGAHA